MHDILLIRNSWAWSVYEQAFKLGNEIILCGPKVSKFRQGGINFCTDLDNDCYFSFCLDFIFQQSSRNWSRWTKTID